VEDAHPEPSHCPAAGAGKLADPAPDVPELVALLLRPERLVRQASAAPGKPDAVPYGGQSCVATEPADAAAQPEPQVSPRLARAAAAAWRAKPSPKLEPRLVPREPSPPADWPDAAALAPPAGRLQALVAQ